MTSDDLYQYTVKLFRMNNAPETLQQMFNCVISKTATTHVAVRPSVLVTVKIDNNKNVFNGLNTHPGHESVMLTTVDVHLHR